jgi:hypothetical protein
MRRHWFLIIGLAALLWWLTTGDIPLISALQNILGRGRRLSATTMDEDGTVTDSEDDLVAAAGKLLGRDVSEDAYTLARIADSEHPSSSIREKAAIMQVCVNDAQTHGWSILQAATSGKGYGHQSGRRYSTARDPYEATLILAEALLAGEVANETRGATHFVHVTGFASAAAYATLCLRWFESMKIVPVKLPGIVSYRLFVPASDGYQAEDTLPEVASG